MKSTPIRESEMTSLNESNKFHGRYCAGARYQSRPGEFILACGKNELKEKGSR